MSIIALLIIAPSARAESIVITDTLHPIATTKDIRTITLDLPSVLEAELSVDLPADPASAQTVFQQRMTPALAARMTQAHQDVADAWSMGVTRVPAMVVDRKYVVYGETGVQRALERVEQYRRAQP